MKKQKVCKICNGVFTRRYTEGKIVFQRRETCSISCSMKLEHLRKKKNGIPSPLIGSKHSEETKKKRSLSNKGKKRSKEFCEQTKIRLKKLWDDPNSRFNSKEYKEIHKKSLEGRKFSKDVKKKMSLSKKEWYSSDAGKRFKEKLSISMMGSNNLEWKGNEVGYNALHSWIRKHKPNSNICECCNKKTKKLGCANTSGEYKRDINDYEWLCYKCHSIKDETFKNLMSSQNIWSKDEMNYLIDNYKKISIKELSEKMNKTIPSIQGKLSRLYKFGIEKKSCLDTPGIIQNGK